MTPNHRATDHETIAAIASPPGEGAISVIRISGKEALRLSRKFFSGDVESYASHTAHYGKVVDKEGKALDQVLCLVMRSPRSYTGEDTVELFCHGGVAVTRRVLARIFEVGIRPAEPGEFSLRAFLNGKMDLAQAEAVQQVIAAKSALAIDAAGSQLGGVLSRKIKEFQKELIETASILEAWVDFPEEGLEFKTLEEMIADLASTRLKMEQLAQTFDDGHALFAGVSVALVGAPNVGKSSVMNALLGHERAIVTDLAGTTRDLLREQLRLSGFTIELVDTAGIRESEERIEKEGIRRSKEVIEKADLLLFLLDGSREIDDAEKRLLDLVPKERTLLVWNKSDLRKREGLSISAKTGEGLEDLKREILQRLEKSVSKEEVILTQERHHGALSRAIEHLETVIQGLQEGSSPEFLAFDLRSSLNELGTILGIDITEEVLSAIFSKFCLGK
jgi:tRNA modification GTPase